MKTVRARVVGERASARARGEISDNVRRNNQHFKLVGMRRAEEGQIEASKSSAKLRLTFGFGVCLALSYEQLEIGCAAALPCGQS